VATLWNPSSAVELYVREIHIVNTTAASANIYLRRATARGTAGSTVTPDIDNEVGRAAASPAGAVLDLATYSVQPTLDASILDQWITAAVIGAGKIWTFPKRIMLPPGQGLSIANSQAVAVAACDITFVWDERE
jgi:hypothetical protein